jgi:transcriptional regulator with XRE-family HTH domain
MGVAGPAWTGSQGSRCLGIIAGFVLKLARRAAGVTQERLAESLAVDVSSVQGWESGRRPLTALQIGDFQRIRACLTRLGVPASIGHHLHEAIEADLVLATAVGAGRRSVGTEEHPLAAGVHRRSLTNLITWPITGILPAQLRLFTAKIPPRGPAATRPALHPGEEVRFFDHLLATAGQAEHALLRRQAVYLLGFDTRQDTAGWLREEWRRATGRRVADDDIEGLLKARSASVALASTGDSDVLHDFVRTLSRGRAETANLNYWAYWIGELPEAQVDDRFMLAADARSWAGHRLLGHLTSRIEPSCRHLSLNVHTLYTLIASRPSLLSDWPAVRGPLSAAVERTASTDGLDRTVRNQLAGVHYALRIANR